MSSIVILCLPLSFCLTLPSSLSLSVLTYLSANHSQHIYLTIFFVWQNLTKIKSRCRRQTCLSCQLSAADRVHLFEPLASVLEYPLKNYRNARAGLALYLPRFTPFSVSPTRFFTTFPLGVFTFLPPACVLLFVLLLLLNINLCSRHLH